MSDSEGEMAEERLAGETSEESFHESDSEGSDGKFILASYKAIYTHA